MLDKNRNNRIELIYLTNSIYKSTKNFYFQSPLEGLIYKKSNHILECSENATTCLKMNEIIEYKGKLLELLLKSQKTEVIESIILFL